MQYLKDLIYSISITNAIDIAIIAALIYAVIAWFKGTRAFQILATVIGMGIIYLVASKTGLVLTSILFQYLWAAIIIVMVIVFQPEIREMLDRASPIRYLSGRQNNNVKADLIDETVNAVTELAGLRIGAIIVFQRLDRLDNVIIKGKPLETLLSTEALIMIFQKGSPLHDGAALVSGSRIKAAGCILPLSGDEHLSSQYGTRHRAALGLAERSDALCVVISEERGEVSIAAGKTMTTYRKKGDFRDALDRGLLKARPGKEGAHLGVLGALKSNWRLKVLALLTSILLWFIVVGPQRSELGISVPLQYTNLPPDMEIAGKWMERIDVRLRGSESGLANLNPGSVRAVVNLSNVVTGLNYFRITAKSIQVPPGIAISEIRPSDLHLNIETASVRKVGVVPSVTGALPEKTKVVIAPAEVQVKGVQVELRKITSAVTESIDIDHLKTRGKLVVPVVIKPDGVKIDSVEPEQVTVSLEAEQG
jgi:diadenylate cyclase